MTGSLRLPKRYYRVVHPTADFSFPMRYPILPKATYSP